jgi:hypothetical protein
MKFDKCFMSVVAAAAAFASNPFHINFRMSPYIVVSKTTTTTTELKIPTNEQEPQNVENVNNFIDNWLQAIKRITHWQKVSSAVDWCVVELLWVEHEHEFHVKHATQRRPRAPIVIADFAVRAAAVVVVELSSCNFRTQFQSMALKQDQGN